MDEPESMVFKFWNPESGMVEVNGSTLNPEWLIVTPNMNGTLNP